VARVEKTMIQAALVVLAGGKGTCYLTSDSALCHFAFDLYGSGMPLQVTEYT